MTIVGDNLCSFFTFLLCLMCNWGNVLHLSYRSVVVTSHILPAPPPPQPNILLYILISLSCDSFTGNVADTFFAGHMNVLIVMLAN